MTLNYNYFCHLSTVIYIVYRRWRCLRFLECIYSGDPEIGPPMELTESGPILESVRFVKPANYEWRDTSQSVCRYALLRVDIKVDY